MMERDGGSIIQSSEYDAEGTRISRTENGSSTYYYYGDDGLIYSDGAAYNTYIRDTDGTVSAAYLGDDYSVYAADFRAAHTPSSMRAVRELPPTPIPISERQKSQEAPQTRYAIQGQSVTALQECTT